MLGQAAVGNISSSSRFFMYEVTGLRQNEENDKNGFQFRSSSSVFVKVPFNSMNEKMQFINRMGGTIVSIKPVTAGESSGESDNGE